MRENGEDVEAVWWYLHVSRWIVSWTKLPGGSTSRHVYSYVCVAVGADVTL
jgi:hypothetical protein